MAKAPLYRVKGWNECFESAKSRTYGLKTQAYMPNKCGLGYRRLLVMPSGEAMFGAWCALIQMLSRKPAPRQGYLTDTTRSDGIRLVSVDIALLTHYREETITAMIAACVSPEVDWLEDVTAPRIPQGYHTDTTGIPDGYPPSPSPLPLPLPSPLPSESAPVDLLEEEVGIGFAGPTRPVALPADVAKAKNHIVGIVKVAEVRAVPNLEAWVEQLIRERGGGPDGVDYVLSYTSEDFSAAQTAYLARKKREQRWSATWIQNAHEDRVEQGKQVQHKGRIAEEVDIAAQNEIAQELAKKFQDELAAMHEAWAKVAVAEKRRLMDEDKGRCGLTTEQITRQKWWAQQKGQGDGKANTPAS